MTEQQITSLKEDLRLLSDKMLQIGKDMAFASSLESELTKHGKELMNASNMARTWLEEDWNE